MAEEQVMNFSFRYMLNEFLCNHSAVIIPNNIELV